MRRDATAEGSIDAVLPAVVLRKVEKAELWGARMVMFVKPARVDTNAGWADKRPVGHELL